MFSLYTDFACTYKDLSSIQVLLKTLTCYDSLTKVSTANLIERFHDFMRFSFNITFLYENFATK